jgi:hypothetical protein
MKYWEILSKGQLTFLQRLDLSSRFFELACVLVRFDHAASFIVNANHGIMRHPLCGGELRKRVVN